MENIEKTNEKLIEEHKMLLKFMKSFIKDFEGDYVMADGRIVDNPNNLLLINYENAKEVIKKIEENE
jgi:hypothetical protein